MAKRKSFSLEKINAINESYKKGAEGFKDLSEFNDAYGHIAGTIRYPEDYRSAVEGIIDEAGRNGQIACEIRCSVIGQKDTDSNGNERSLSPELAAENIIQAIIKKQTELDFAPPYVGFTFLGYRGRDNYKTTIIDGVEVQVEDLERTISEVLQHAQLLVKMAEKYPRIKFSFDIAGPEDSGLGPENFIDAYKIISEYNQNPNRIGERIGTTIHAGETPTYEENLLNEKGAVIGHQTKPGSEGVKKVLELLRPDRIGHGVHAIDDPEVMKLLHDHDTTVEICGVCNAATIPKNTEGLTKHPVDDFSEAGIDVIYSTDNDAICGTNINAELYKFMLTGHASTMNWHTLKNQLKKTIDNTFISEEQKVNAHRVFNERIKLVEDLFYNALKVNPVRFAANDNNPERGYSFEIAA